MVSHPNRSKKNPKPGRNPTPQEIVNARKMAKLTQPQAAELIYKTLSIWRKWEKDISQPDHRRMQPDTWELFLIKTGFLDQYLKNPNIFKKDLSTPDPSAQ